MNRKKNQPNYSEAKKQAIADIKAELKKAEKCFIAFNPRITIEINIYLADHELHCD